jgi:hypothetical protein
MFDFNPTETLLSDKDIPMNDDLREFFLSTFQHMDT